MRSDEKMRLKKVDPSSLILNDDETTVFYMMTKGFQSQRQLDEAVLDACALIRVPRRSLNIVSTSKGSVVGPIRVKVGVSPLFRRELELGVEIKGGQMI